MFNKNLFISYSHKDSYWLERVKVHLQPLVRDGSFECWDDTRITAGENWQAEIELSLAQATAAILLVSPDFYASDFIAERELPPLLLKAAAKDTKILILVVDHCRYRRDSALSQFQAIHDPAMPLAALSPSSQNKVFDSLARAVEQACNPAQLQTELGVIGYEPRVVVCRPHFVGRAAEIRELGLALDRGESISLVGDWRIGKSSILATWAKEARMRGRIVRELSGEGAESVDVSSFVSKIIGSEAHRDVELAAAQLDAWARATGPMPPILLVDEAGQVLRSFSARFWSRVRGMLERVSWVFATRLEIREISPDSPLMNRLGLIRLGLIDNDAAEQLIARGNFDKVRNDLLREWAGRHPFYLQLLGRYLVDCPDMVEALERFRDEASSRLNELISTLHARDLSALLNVDVESLQMNRRLIRRGIVDHSGQPFGRVLTDWIANRL